MTLELLAGYVFFIALSLAFAREWHREKHQRERWEEKAHLHAEIADCWEQKAHALDDLLKNAESMPCPVCAANIKAEKAYAKLASMIKQKLEAAMPGLTVHPIQLVGSSPNIVPDVQESKPLTVVSECNGHKFVVRFLPADAPAALLAVQKWYDIPELGLCKQHALQMQEYIVQGAQIHG